MLSVENPPPDLSSCIKTTTPFSNDSEKTTPPSASPQKLFVLPNIDQLSTNFSIRDYAFAARNKDITASWPFSRKHLQLCLDNGVKDLLPPFRCLDSLGNNRRCLLELAEGNVSNSDEKRLQLGDQLVPSSGSSLNSGCNDELAEGYPDLYPSPSPSGGEKDMESEVEPASTKKRPLLEVSDGLEVAAPAVGAIQPQASNTKKSRLIVKLGSKTVHKSATEDIKSTSEASSMAAKICPVCQTFSSSSNTTLNAHIDQCLSINSTSMWLENCKLTKSRIKPRKMRLMADIYATAQCCTLQDLDQRNGTNWAMEINVHAQAANATAEGKIQTSSSTCIQDGVNDGAVYVDANGTKIRILSRSYDASLVMRARDDLKTKKLPRKSKGNRLLSLNKKRRYAKQLKYLKLNPPVCHTNGFSPEVFKQETGDEEANIRCKERKQLAPVFKDHEQKRLDDSLTQRKWACSKTTGLLKKSKAKDGPQHSKYKFPLMEDLPAESDPLYFGGGLTVKSHTVRDSGSPERCGFPAKTSRRKDVPSHRAEFNDMNNPLGRKRGGGLLLRDSLCNNAESFLQPSILVTSHFRGVNVSEDEAAIDIHAGALEISNASGTSSQGFHAFSSKGVTLPSLRENVCLPSQTSNPACQFNPSRQGSALMKCSVNKVGEELAAWPAEVLLRSDSVPDCDVNSHEESKISNSLGRRSSLKIRARRGLGSIYLKGNAMTSEVPQSAHCFRGPGEVGKNDCSDRATDEIQGCIESVVREIPNDGLVFVTDTSSGAAKNLSRSSGTELCKLSNVNDSLLTTRQFNEEYQGHIFRDEASTPLVRPSSSNDPVMFSAGETGISLVEPEIADTDSKLGQGSFLVVDTIPIPGPPGSYLPSPRDMESEVLQGNSSLTTSRIHCSCDPCEIADGDSSDIPVSALSTVSNFMETKSVLNNSELCVQPHSVQDMVCSGFPSSGHSPENVSTFSQAESEDNEMVMLGEDGTQGGIMLQLEGALREHSNNQPCSCSWKERIHYQESLLLKQQWITSISLPTIAKQKGPEFDTAANNVMARETSSVTDCSETTDERAAHSAAIPPRATTPAAIAADASNNLSPSTLVLRLMGKNLMVVNNVEMEEVHALNQPSLNDCEIMRASNISGISSGSQHLHYSSCDTGPLVHGEDPHVMMVQNFTVPPPCNFDNFRMLHKPTQA
ncbi:hypothetical protein Ancab_024840 [Ancistrocladus abbreviatus]